MSKIIRINEMFPGIQGEGLTNGLPAYFVRTSGCNLNCDFCDTKYHKEKTEYLVTDVVDSIRDSKLEDVVFTGGEPMLQIDAISDVMSYLPQHTFHLETNGSIYDDRVKKFRFIACSPKKQAIDNLTSYEKFRMLPQTFFKFVYESKQDRWWEHFMIDARITPDRIWIMPEGGTRREQIIKMPHVMNYCLENKFKFSPRLHVLAWDNRRGI